MAMLASFAAVVIALVTLGCDGGDSSDAAGSRSPGEPRPASALARRPALCARLRVQVTGRVATPAATELSGLVLSRSQPGVLWTHNDSGDGPRLLAVARDGRLLADVAVTGAEHVDWEDIAIGPAPAGGDALYVGDIGDNPGDRPEVVVYRLPEPRVGGGGAGASAAAERLTLRYPDGPHDAEALLVEPVAGALAIVTKDFGGTARVYAAGAPTAGTTTTMRSAGRVSLGPGEAVTAGDLSGNGRTLALRTYDRAFVWRRRRGQSLASVLRRRPCAARAELASEGQSEALALTRDGRAFYTVPEGRRPALRRYAPGGH